MLARARENKDSPRDMKKTSGMRACQSINPRMGTSGVVFCWTEWGKAHIESICLSRAPVLLFPRVLTQALDACHSKSDIRHHGVDDVASEGDAERPALIRPRI